MSEEEGRNGLQSTRERISLERQGLGQLSSWDGWVWNLPSFPGFSSVGTSWSPNLKRTIPGVPSLCASILMTGSIYFMISTQYRLPWFLVAVTMQKSMHELRGLQMSLAGTCPSHGGKKITFFEKNFPKIWGVNREFQEDFWEQHMALIISRFKGSSVESVPTFHPTVSECAACQGFPSSVFTSL